MSEAEAATAEDAETVAPSPDKATWQWAAKCAGAGAALDSKEKITDFLVGVPLFAPLLRHEIDKLASFSLVAHYKDRQNVIVQGDTGQMFFILVSGSCEAKVDGAHVNTYKSTDFFGEIAMFRDDTIRSATITAVGPTTCIKFSRTEFESLLKVTNVGNSLRDRVKALLSDGYELTGLETYSVEMAQPGGTRKSVPVTGEPNVPLHKVVETNIFKNWVKEVENDEKLFVAAVHVTDVDMFGPRIGFLKFKARALVEVGGDEGEGSNGIIEVPGIVFMRGGAVGVLVILECEGVDYTILTHQARVPIGCSDLPEIPAGMLDGSGHFKGVAAEEIQEECHIVISEDELVDMTELAYGKKWRGMIPSAGGCDEFIKLYIFRRSVERDVINELEGRLTGLPEEGERIKLHLVKLNDLWRSCPDAKALSALTLFHELKREGLIPESLLKTATEVHGVAELGQEQEPGIVADTHPRAIIRPSGRSACSDADGSDGVLSFSGSADLLSASSRGNSLVSSYDSQNQHSSAGSGSRASPTSDSASMASKDSLVSKDSGEGANEPAVDDTDTCSRLSSSGFIKGAPTSRHRGRRDAGRMDRGSSLPLFKKLEKEAASWKKKYNETTAQNEALVAEITALKASILGAS
jgi:ADP-sugar diphosphatase